jgi:transposase-like protein
MSDPITAPAASENFPKLPISAENHDVLSDKQRAAIELLLSGKSRTAVAKSVDVTPRTLYTWRQCDVFRDELERRRHELWDGAAERLRALVHPALDVLEEEVHDVYDRARMRAVGVILRFADLRKCVPPGKAEDRDLRG